MGISLLKIAQDGNIFDAWVLSRYYYSESLAGTLPDDIYDAITLEYRNKGMYTEYLQRTYEQDPYPSDLLIKYGLKEETGMMPISFDNNFEKYKGYLMNDGTYSINPLIDIKDIYNFFMSTKGKPKHASLKVDGVNDSNLLQRKGDTTYEHLISMSRARDGAEPIDYSYGMKKILPKKFLINSDSEFLDVRGEGYLSYKGIEPLRKLAIDKKRKIANPRTGGSSILRTKYPDSYYQYLKFLAYSCTGLSDTVSGTYKELQRIGFETPPSVLIDDTDMPETIKEFKDWLYNITDKLYFESIERGIPSDGVVIELDDLDGDFAVDGAYTSRAIAMKTGRWEAKIYKGIVKSIIVKTNAVLASTRIEIQPIEAEDGCTNTYINTYNPSIVIGLGASPGNEIYFQRKSGTNSTILYGRELEEYLKLIE